MPFNRSDDKKQKAAERKASRRRRSKQGRMLLLRPSGERSTKQVQWDELRPRGLPGVPSFRLKST
jgi:1-acyl-sn-glycerol-3-phosphate acyltransferase